MQIVVPYKRLNERTGRAVINSGYPYRLVYMEDDYHYLRLMHEIWEAGESTIIVEQDIVPTWLQIKDMVECPQDCCTMLYELRGTPTASLGFCKFSADLMKRVRLRYPEWWDHGLDKRPPKWWHVDGYVFANVYPHLQTPYTPHRHDGFVEHQRDMTLARPHGHG